MTRTVKEYAEALFMLAREQDRVAEYSRSLAIVENAFRENPEYIELLSSPHISRAERTGAVEDAFGEALDEDMVSFLMLMCESNHIPQFFDCVREYELLYREYRRVAEATVTSAVALSDEQKTALQTKLEKRVGKTVLLTNRVDPGLLGGVVVEIDGKLIDGSLRHRLAEVKEVLSGE